MTEIEQQLLSAFEQLNNDVSNRFNRLTQQLNELNQQLAGLQGTLDDGSETGSPSPLQSELNTLETKFTRLLNELDGRLSLLERGR